MACYDTAMILAAGRGERMRPLTDQLPKPMLAVAGAPLLVHHLRRLAAAGIKRVVINHAWLGEKITQYFSQAEHHGLELLFSPEPAGGLETAGGIIQALPLLDREQFVVVNGDVYCDFAFEHLPSLQQQQAHLLLVNNPSHHREGDFALSEQGYVVAKQGNNGLTFAGIACYQRAFFADLAATKRPLRPLFEAAIGQAKITGQYYSGRWCDVGTPERLFELNQTLTVAG